MSKLSSTLAEDLAKRFRALETSRKKIEKLAVRGLLSQRDVKHSYEGLFLTAHVYFENFIEELFIGLLVDGKGLKSTRSDVVPRIVVKTHQIAREMIVGPRRSYTDWLPYDHTIQLGKKFFRGGRPFTDLAKPQKQTLQKASIIRNVIAHRSRHSTRQFETNLVHGMALLPQEGTPIGYLRGLFRISPPQTRFENYLAELLRIARFLAK